VSVLIADHETLARAVADNLVISVDPVARGISATWSEESRPWTSAVVRATMEIEDRGIRLAAQCLLGDPAEPRLHTGIIRALLAGDRDRPTLAAAFERAWEAECNSRLGYHLGSLYGASGLRAPSVAVDDLLVQPRTPSVHADDDAAISVVIPFRDRTSDFGRLRNLLACLQALGDQSYPRSGYRVTVVEADETPRCREAIVSYADHYLFAPDAGEFNKSWAVNAGVMHSPGRPEVICVLDSDVLTDRDFITRNADRFRKPGTGGHLPYRNMFCMDPGATSIAIVERLARRQPEADPSMLRGFFLRRPPGCCVWVRMATFHRIGGMDERYRGWGGEDYDFIHRLDVATPLNTYDDWLLHLYHRAAPMPIPYAESANASIPSLSWQPTEPVGRLDRFASSETTAC
jgi:hypothetical protein